MVLNGGGESRPSSFGRGHLGLRPAGGKRVSETVLGLGPGSSVFLESGIVKIGEFTFVQTVRSLNSLSVAISREHTQLAHTERQCLSHSGSQTLSCANAATLEPTAGAEEGTPTLLGDICKQPAEQ